MTDSVEPATERDEEMLVRQHLPLVRRAVAQAAAKMPRHTPRDDLFAAGLAGLGQAARNYDCSREIPFHHYAVARIKGAILDELRKQDWATRPVRAKARQMERTTERLTTALGRPPTEAELAAAMGIDREALQGLTLDLHRATVLNYEALLPNGDGEALVVSQETPEVELLERELNAYLVDAIRALPPRLQVIVMGCFFRDRGMQEIGLELGVSESRVSQLRTEALDLLRQGLNSQLEADWTPVPSSAPVARRRRAYFAAIAASSTPNERLGSKPRLLAAPACA